MDDIVYHNPVSGQIKRDTVLEPSVSQHNRKYCSRRQPVLRIGGKRHCFLWLALTVVVSILSVCPHIARAQSPELAMRDLSSGQIKKGVRTMGLGGDGATWGNYALVWKDENSGLVDYGDTAYTNGNDFGSASLDFHVGLLP